MFGRVFYMELKRCCSWRRLASAVGILTAVFLLTAWNDFRIGEMIQAFPIRNEYTGSLGMLQTVMVLNRYTVICVFVLGWLHAGSFARDDEYKYLRAILSRTDITTYTQCRFLSNIVAVCTASVLSFYLFVLILLPFSRIIAGEQEIKTGFYENYRWIAREMPLLMVGMMGLQFGMIASAASSIGLLYSAYRVNYFVSIAMGGMVFYTAISFLDLFLNGQIGGIFDIRDMMSMYPAVGVQFPWWINYAWGMIFPLTIVLVCGCLFYRRMKWRVENGYI